MSASRPTSTRDLFPSERRLLVAMRELGYGRFEFVQVRHGEVVLDPQPTVVRDVKFGTTDPVALRQFPAEFELKQQVAELFEYVRSVEAGEIRALEVKNGLPFSMEVELAAGRARGGRL